MRSVFTCFILLIFFQLSGKDIYVTGKVTDITGVPVADAKISMKSGSIEYAVLSGIDGTYKLRVAGIYSDLHDQLETGTPFPNPFAGSVYLPFITAGDGDLRFSVYSMTGRKIKDQVFRGVTAGSYRILWGGTGDGGSPVGQGYYIYAITFNGTTRAGRLVKARGAAYGSSQTTLEEVMMPLPVATPPSGPRPVPVIATVSGKSYNPVRITDIVLKKDTIIDFEVTPASSIPFKTQSGFIAMYTSPGYRPVTLKGINLGASPPGTFPGEIAYAISGDMYEKWINRMAKAGFNCIRVYTLHPPVFYEKLSNYNARHPDEPLLLFQGIWLDEITDPTSEIQYDLVRRTGSFKNEIHDVIDCVHGNKSIAFRYGKAWGEYLSDISQWIAGFIIGREISPQEILKTNLLNTSFTSFTGSLFSISGASPSEAFITNMLDETSDYESKKYSSMRPVSISSWPTLDPLTHPSEKFPDEDLASFDIYKITGKTSGGGIFATYHAYPYYPNFVSDDPYYRTFSDTEGPDSYLGYLTDLKNHYSEIPLVIGEFGVPSSWGSAHQSFSGMDHGGYSELQQGEKNLRMLKNVFDAGCAGGFMFSWMDEWFKPTWIVQYLEAYGFYSGGELIPTRQLWQNAVSPEQNFGMISFTQKETLPFIPYRLHSEQGYINKIEASNDNAFFYLNGELDKNFTAGDTLLIALDTYLSFTGESLLPGGHSLGNRSEFLLEFIGGKDTALYYVTEAYDMKGLTPRFNLSDPSVQKYKSISTSGAPWVLMEWINDGIEKTRFKIGKLPVEHAAAFTAGERSAVAWMNNKFRVRLPWTLLYFYDPTRMQVINGAVSPDGGYTFNIIPATSDGISVSACYKGIVTDADSRYTWDSWMVAPPVTDTEKESLHVVEAGLVLIPFFAD